MSGKPVIIFDFDGTLADSFGVAVDLMLHITHRAALPKEDMSRLRGLDPLPLLRELKIPLWRVPLLMWRARRLFGQRIAEVALFSDIDRIIPKLAKQATLYVLSSNSTANVRAVLQRGGVEQYFAGVYGGARPMHKERSLQRLAHENKLMVANAWYVGDEAQDIIAAHHLGMRVAAVTWGYNNIIALKRHDPDALVFSPEELCATLVKAVHEQ